MERVSKVVIEGRSRGNNRRKEGRNKGGKGQRKEGMKVLAYCHA
jgi:hypothetical protein